MKERPMPDIEALKTLVPQIEKQEGQWPDELLGRFLCAVRGFELVWLSDENYADLEIRGVIGKNADVQVFKAPRYRCPDTDLTAADKLCGELLPKGMFRYTNRADGIKECWVWPGGEHETKGRYAYHNHRLATSIMIALARALIAEGEG